ncbi:hypothetical protein [Pengzhenrongella frigida]|uniref:Uncharacterized protein n=1 Tax=Pengzhenrongella frigida TaxID=1259133 RepID=A0A4Q5N1T1_9MICO|nr:hypothetical protein [Cellulomonas sp. HLT2-17]RYV52049.1 hypothetical protein EUA98_05645 [Cellulomonas sp. HLT2-17]
MSPVTALFVIAASLCVTVFELSRIRSWPKESVSYVIFRDTRRTPLGTISGWAGGWFWTAAVVSIVIQGTSWPWIAAFCTLLIAPGFILVWAHNRRVIADVENGLPA